MRGHGDDLGVDEIDGPDRVFGATDHGDVVDRRSPHRVALQIGRAHRDGQQALGAVRGERLDQGLGRVGSADDDGALHELAVGAVAPQPSTQHESSDERARDEDPDDGEQVGARGPHAPDVGHDGHDSDEHESGVATAVCLAPAMGVNSVSSLGMGCGKSSACQARAPMPSTTLTWLAGKRTEAEWFRFSTRPHRDWKADLALAASTPALSVHTMNMALRLGSSVVCCALYDMTVAGWFAVKRPC